ncbi:spore cortex biosynthesis protein YabQ [Alkalihalobacillus pseudalcaliphilus]|uniref:spore cortex biosynthesis protein YabQ n=1 Tax=Alkalihalobacillus pseudalcaliphilus TaxID=79884 RepID=UPI00064E1308|nr:spore cortex biosynthesis protein YabQ [Alkalihalobacillus pseudalcaliphilus]KMK74498.1 spore coat protein [Alkalihalobacillus pseudalcaliphilus]
MSLTVQLYTMLSMTAFGLWVGASIDTYRRFTRERSSFHWLTALNDVVFWLLQGCLLFFVLLQVNFGEIRFYVFVAILCGYAAYQALCQKLYVKLLNKTIQAVISIYHFVVKLLTILFINPIKFVLKLLYSLCMMLVTTCLSVTLYVLNLVWKLLKGVLNIILKVTMLYKITDKLSIWIQPYVKKIQEFLTKMWNKWRIRKKKD